MKLFEPSRFKLKICPAFGGLFFRAFNTLLDFILRNFPGSLLVFDFTLDFVPFFVFPLLGFTTSVLSWTALASTWSEGSILLTCVSTMRRVFRFGSAPSVTGVSGLSFDSPPSSLSHSLPLPLSLFFLSSFSWSWSRRLTTWGEAEASECHPWPCMQKLCSFVLISQMLQYQESFLSKILDSKGLGQTKVRQEPFHTSHKGWTGMLEQLDSLVPGS